MLGRHALLGAALWAALFVPAAGYAADSTGQFMAEGPGRQTCAAVFDAGAGDGEKTRLTAAWLTGYLSALNQVLPDTFDLTPWQTPATILTYVKRYCDANPQSTMSSASQYLVNFLRPNRLTTATPLVSLGVGTRKVVLYDEVVARARKALGVAGFAAGPSLEDLAATVRAYQTAQGLAVTGILNQQTLARLLR